jgi:hypothetical protein
MTEMGLRAIANKPDRVVLVSPHSPRHATRFSIWSGMHRGDLGDFGAAQLRVSLPDAPEVAQALSLPLISDKDIPRNEWLDHGAMVPLYFLWLAGWRGPTSIIALPWSQKPDSEALGRSIADLDGRTALIASGDMSHRLIQGAPAGFHPHAKDFDSGFVEALHQEKWSDVGTLPWRDEAAEDVVDSTRVACGAAGAPLHAEVLAYEGPWGVGYTEAVLCDPHPPLYAIARKALRKQMRGEPYSPPAGGPECAGTFVTLRMNGQLRGCIGRIQTPQSGTFAQIADNARSAATRDTRFPPVSIEELDDIDIEISVLEMPEPISGIQDLNPDIFGVIVRSGHRSGVMLPNVEGIDNAEQQVLLTCKKVGINPYGDLEFERFRVRKEVQP